jgi:hypothetical protein
LRIENLRSERYNSLVRVAASVVWEDAHRPAQEIYVATEEAFGRDLAANADAFTVAGIMPALIHGERRLAVDGSICPELKEGLATAMRLIHHWYGLHRDPLLLEVGVRPTALTLPHQRAGVFFSGGVDCLAAVRANRLHVPLSHSASLKDGIVVDGLSPFHLRPSGHTWAAMSEVAREVGITLIPAYTNFRQLDRSYLFWRDQFQAAVFSAVGHAFARRLSVLSLSSSRDITHLHPHGSHPLLDPNYSSSELRIFHGSLTMSRLQKTKLVAEWEVALHNLRVCIAPRRVPPGQLNCGTCEKCVRTMLTLAAIGALDRASTFPGHRLSPDLVRARVHVDHTTHPFYEELVEALAGAGQPQLERAVRHKLREYRLQHLGRSLWPGRSRPDRDQVHRRGHPHLRKVL